MSRTWLPGWCCIHGARDYYLDPLGWPCRWHGVDTPQHRAAAHRAWEASDELRVPPSPRERIPGLLDDLEALYDASPSARVTKVPAPGTVHPYWEHAAPSLRRIMAGSPHSTAINAVRPNWPRWSFTDITTPSSTETDMVVTLTVRRAYGRAPYVGDPFVYVWQVASDGHGRHIATDVSLRYVPEGAG